MTDAAGGPGAARSMMDGAAAPILRCTGIVKSFPGVRALRGVDFAVLPGRVHGLVGENGAGKSTLAKVIAGVYRPDAGILELDGRPLALRGADEALAQGIVTVHQDVNLVTSQTVAENIFLNHEPTSGPLGFIRGREMRARTAELLARCHVEASPDALVSDLPNDVRKMVQIVKAVSRRARVLLLDEPTSALTETEVRVVLRLIRELAGQGVGIVFISHYLSEVFEITDDITVLRDGEVTLACPTASTHVGAVVEAMLGRKLAAQELRPQRGEPGPPVLEVEGLSLRNGPRDISFTVGRGEVLGITGLTGSGLTELAKALFAAPGLKREAGRIRVDGEDRTPADPAEALGTGMALLTNDRLREGILLDFPLVDNVCLPILDRFRKALGLLDAGAMRATAARAVERFKVRTTGPTALARTLSGGNQQKVLFAKWLETRPKVFVMDEPTIGVDVGSKADIRAAIEEIAASGVGIVLITAELDELTSLCDRVLVMFRGALVAELKGAEIERVRILHASVSGLPA